ncbi:cell division control protein 6 [Methanohalophilus levihalophilus]|uniref:Cdc6/Cdc18 family protein n=1 Tax=Methanohalophilus levihalophilus TaxID=1431282 RepID=UPI001AE6AEBD|nr:AAA family ATPase [Methanohalophilus levihalophilus]MBP2029734.1 cell division control protein 6 [Methanohalophilus levihalophilus]
MNDIFKTESIIFQKKAVLSEQYLPDSLIARDGQIREIAELIEPSLHRGVPNNGLIMGQKGTGKTSVAKFVIKQFNEIAPKDEIDTVCIFVNCGIANTVSRVILEIVHQVSPELQVPKTGLSMNEYYNILWDALNEKQTSIIVVLDDLEMLKNLDILMSLSQAGGKMHIANDVHIGIIGISNDVFFTEKLSPGLIQSVNYKEVIFPPYNEEELAEILNSRSSIAFREEVIDEYVIPTCILLSQKDGYAYKAIKLLEKAGNIAERKNEDFVSDKHVFLANDELKSESGIETLKKLPIHQKLVLLSVVRLAKVSDEKITTGQVVAEYQDLCSKLDLNPLGRTSVSKMISEFDMQDIISASHRSRGRYGKTRLINVKWDRDRIKEALYYDYKLKDL